SLTTSIPASACFRSTSTMPFRTVGPAASRSIFFPDIMPIISSRYSGGPSNRPACVVRMRFVLRFIGFATASISSLGELKYRNFLHATSVPAGCNGGTKSRCGARIRGYTPVWNLNKPVLLEKEDRMLVRNSLLVAFLGALAVGAAPAPVTYGINFTLTQGNSP